MCISSIDNTSFQILDIIKMFHVKLWTVKKWIFLHNQKFLIYGFFNSVMNFELKWLWSLLIQGWSKIFSAFF